VYRVLLTRRWLVATIVVVAALVTMVQFGFWQLRRLDEVRGDNARVRSRLAQPAEPVERLLPPSGDPEAATFRRATVEGRYEPGGEVVLANRSYRGSAGIHVLTPLRTSDGRALIVDRGWVPLRTTLQEVRPTDEPVRVVGVLFPSERKGAFGSSIPPGERVTQVPRVDVARIAGQLMGPAYPLYLRLQSQTPPQGAELPVPPGVPGLDEGSHFSYAVQWFIFATIAALTYGALARRASKHVPARERK
jgi:cytochrome oxidase assembly protein ShyY1